jgi:hypothetical protein
VRVTFVRTLGKHDRVYVKRTNGSESSWSFPSYGDALPHDLVHLVCEIELGVRDGIYGRVAAGADLREINQKANRKGGKDKYRALGRDLEGVLWSEALAAAPWDRGDDEVRDELVALARRMGGGVRAVTKEDIHRVREALAEMRARWRRLSDRESIVVEYPE